MPLQKNQLLTLRIERLSSDGSGVAHSADGEAVFVPNTAPAPVPAAAAACVISAIRQSCRPNTRT